MEDEIEKLKEEIDELREQLARLTRMVLINKYYPQPTRINAIADKELPTKDKPHIPTIEG